MEAALPDGEVSKEGFGRSCMRHFPGHPWEKETAAERIRVEGMTLVLSAALIFMLPISYIN